MPQPPAYDRQYSFTAFSASNPSDQQPGTQIDGELNAVKATLDAILSNLLLIQRDDGPLKNGSVALEQLATDVIALLGGGNWTIKGSWATATAYVVGDVVVEAGGTYVCATAHTSGTFSTDLAAEKWATIYGATSVTVPDGGVTTPKIVDGAVTSPKLASTLAISGNFSAGTLTGGTLTPGTYLVGGLKASGNAINYIGRTTRAQGEVGLWIDGGASGAVWKLSQASSSDTLTLSNTIGGVTTAVFHEGGRVDWNFTQRVMGALTPSSGSGLEFYYTGGVGYVDAYNRTGSSWLPVKVRGSTVTLAGGGTDIVKVTSTGATVSDLTNDIPIGYRGMPRVDKTASYTLALTDQGKMISITTGGVIIPANASVAFPSAQTDQTVIGIYNNSGSSQTISITSDTLRQAGTTNTGTRTLAARGYATLVKIAATEWIIMGPGVS